MSAADSICPDDLMALVRRGAVDDERWATLMAHLRMCDECRALWFAARAFDLAGRTETEDERLVNRAATAALDTLAPPTRLKPVFRAAAAIVASLTGAVAMAAAGMAIERRIHPSPSPSPARVEAPAAPAPRPAHPRRSAAAVPVSPAPEPAPEPAPPPTPAAPPAASNSRTDRTLPAAALFARATAARRAGHVREAIAIFQQLERAYPRSPEAMVSLVSAGELLAEGIDPSAALDRLDEYLRRSPSGPLAPEALSDKARLLTRLGRAAEAQRARDELVRRFPGWTHAVRSVSSDQP